MGAGRRRLPHRDRRRPRRHLRVDAALSASAVAAGRGGRPARRPPGAHACPRPRWAGPAMLARRCSSAWLAAWLQRRVRRGVRTIAAAARRGAGGDRHLRRSGQVDDLREISAPAKLAGMVLAGSMLSLAGVSIVFFRIPFFGLVRRSSPDLPPLVTVVWVVGMANAINLIDGLDGLAAGIVAIAAGAFFLYGERARRPWACIDPGNIGPLMAAAVRRGVPRLPAVELPPGADLHGRRRRPAARPAHGGVDDRRRRQLRLAVHRPDLLLLRPAVHPARHPRRAAPRHGVRHPAARPQRARASPWPTRATSTTG